MLNNVVLVGRLVKDIELRHTNSGKAVAQFTLAVQERRDEEADFIECVVWDKVAEATALYTHKGSVLGVKGRLKKRNYEDSTGRKVYVTEVVCDKVVFLDSKPAQNNKPDQEEIIEQPYNDITADDLPF